MATSLCIRFRAQKKPRRLGGVLALNGDQTQWVVSSLVSDSFAALA